MAIRRQDDQRPLSKKEKLDLFRDCTVVHPHLKKAYSEFLHGVNNPGGASLIFLFGPTGVGKTTLLRQIMKKILEEKSMIVFLTDEAQRFSKMANSSRQQAQMDAIQSMASMTGILHGLFGTYELLEFRNLSAQLSRRSIDIHFPRYRADCASDLVEFQRVLKSFGEKMTLDSPPLLETHWEYFYERSIGCVGILKDWLTQAYCKALEENSSTLSEQHWQQRCTLHI